MPTSVFISYRKCVRLSIAPNSHKREDCTSTSGKCRIDLKNRINFEGFGWYASVVHLARSYTLIFLEFEGYGWYASVVHLARNFTLIFHEFAKVFTKEFKNNCNFVIQMQ